MKILKHDHHQDIILNDDFDLYTKEEYLEYRKNWKEFPSNKFVSNYPLNLDIFVTNRCNLKCIMCNRTKEVEHGTLKKIEDLDLGLYKRIIDEAAEEGVYAVHFTGDGEPLLHENIIEMIEYARNKNILDVFMHTNAMLLSPEMSMSILKAGLTRLIISIDSSVKETYESIRIGADFDRVIYNIETFVKLKKKFKYPILRVQLVKMKNNQDELDKYHEFFSPIADVIGYSDYINYFDMDDGGKEIKKKNFRNNFVCNHLWRRLTIDVNGSVYACIPAPESLYLGNANDNTIKELWHGERMSEVRRFYEEGNVECLKNICTCSRQFK